MGYTGASCEWGESCHPLSPSETSVQWDTQGRAMRQVSLPALSPFPLFNGGLFLNTNTNLAKYLNPNTSGLKKLKIQIRHLSKYSNPNSGGSNPGTAYRLHFLKNWLSVSVKVGTDKISAIGFGQISAIFGWFFPGQIGKHRYIGNL